MPAIYFAELPEFFPLRDALKRQGGKLDRIGIYERVSFDRPIAVTRAETGMVDAVWFGSLVGGMEGELVAFTDERLEIA